MSSNVRLWFAWFLPFLVSGGMAFGAIIGRTSLTDAARLEGPAGDIAGAAGALMVVICIIVGFVMATITIIVVKVLHHGTPDHLFFRLLLSIASGGIIGVLGTYTSTAATAGAWLLLLVMPVLLTWPWHSGVNPVEKPTGEQ